jgi:SnoaL-like domain
MVDDVVAQYQKALGDGNFEAARALLRDDLRFKGPFDEFTSADDYLSAVRRLWGIVESVQPRHVSSAGDEVVVLYDMATKTPAGTQLICEWYRVEGDKIASIRALFDSAPFAFLRGEH